MKVEVGERGEIILKEIYNGITLESNAGEKITICMRDSGFEIDYEKKKYTAKEGLLYAPLDVIAAAINKEHAPYSKEQTFEVIHQIVVSIIFSKEFNSAKVSAVKDMIEKILCNLGIAKEYHEWTRGLGFDTMEKHITEYVEKISNVESEAKPVEKRWENRCRNELFQCINEWKNVETIDDKHNPMITFERYFEDWDSDAMLLTKWNWNHTAGYVYIDKIGVYTNIGSLARALQHLLPSQKEIGVEEMGGDEIEFRIYEDDNLQNSEVYQIHFIDIDQKKPSQDSHGEGWKFDLEKTKVASQ